MTAYRITLAVIAAIGGAVAIVFTWQPIVASFFDDSVSYLLMAQALSPFGGTDPSVLEAARREKYPPLFPLLLAITNGAFDWRVAHAVVALCFAGSIYFLGAYARAISGSRRLAIEAAILYAVLPGTWLNIKGILSEFPYMALAFAALAYHALHRDRPLDVKSSIVLGVLGASALLTRSIGITLVAAIGLAEFMRFLRTRDREALHGLVIVVAIPCVAGAIWFAARPTGGEDPYRDAWTASYIASNLSALLDAWLNSLLIYWGEPWKPAYIGGCVLLLASLAVAVLRAIRGESDGLYCLLFVLLLLFYPFPGQIYRLAFPLVPLLIVNALWGVHALIAKRAGVAAAERWAPFSAMLPLALCIPPLFFIVGRAGAVGHAGENHPLTAITEFYRFPNLPAARATAAMEIGALEDMERIRATTPREARIMWVMPNYVALLANRHAVPLERTTSPDALAKQVVQSGADYIYLSNVHPRDSLLRQGSSVAEWNNARDFTRVAWQRGVPNGEVYGILLKVDRDKALTASADR